MSQIQDQLENIPGYDVVMDYFNEYGEEHWNAKVNPFEDENGNKRRLPKDLATKHDQQVWKQIQSQAWTDDKCFLGSCAVGLDCGLGLAPLVVLIFPVLGPLIMYRVHTRVINIAQKNYNLPNTLIAKLQTNIMIDLLITFPPVIGSFFGWLHACSTRNAGMIYIYLEKMLKHKVSGQGVSYVGARMTAGTYEGQPNAGSSVQGSRPQTVKSTGLFKKKPTTNNSIRVGQQESGFM